MEKIGLIRAVESLKRKGVKINELVTDASSTVIKHLGMSSLTVTTKNSNIPTFSAERDPLFKDTFHSLDVWHKAKKLSKAITEVISLLYRLQISQTNMQLL